MCVEQLVGALYRHLQILPQNHHPFMFFLVEIHVVDLSSDCTFHLLWHNFSMDVAVLGSLHAGGI